MTLLNSLYTSYQLKKVVDKVSDRLQNINSFKDIAKVLYSTRAGVSYMATGAMAGALRATLNYVTERKQFGKEISKYQLIQEKLAMRSEERRVGKECRYM